MLPPLPPPKKRILDILKYFKEIIGFFLAIVAAGTAIVAAVTYFATKQQLGDLTSATKQQLGDLTSATKQQLGDLTSATKQQLGEQKCLMNSNIIMLQGKMDAANLSQILFKNQQEIALLEVKHL
jgi:hypothetical protein